MTHVRAMVAGGLFPPGGPPGGTVGGLCVSVNNMEHAPHASPRRCSNIYLFFAGGEDDETVSNISMRCQNVEYPGIS